MTREKTRSRDQSYTRYQTIRHVSLAVSRDGTEEAAEGDLCHMKGRSTWSRSILGIALAGFALVAVRADRGSPPNTGMADPVALTDAFDRFATGAPPANTVLLSLSNLRGITDEPVNAGGHVVVDLTTGVVTSSAQLLPKDDSFDLWLVDNQPGPHRTTLADPTDRLMFIGTYVVEGDVHSLTPPATLGPKAFETFFPDRAFVVSSGENPVNRFLLTGASTFFDRLRREQVRFVDEAAAPAGVDATASAIRATDFARLVAQGRQLFLKETFNGNGRTCGTCHVETNNFTIDPDLIGTLPPSDPLFVAETNPTLATLENPDLLRRFGLILVNADGFNPPDGGPEFVLRATQNVQALANSFVAPTDGTVH